MHKTHFLVFMLILALSLSFSLISCGEADNGEVGELLVTKTSSHEKLRTVHPGDIITYTFTLKNQTKSDKAFQITDTVPENTSYKSGDASVYGNELTFEGSVPKGETVTVSYSVAVTEDREAIGSVISSDSAKFMGKDIPCEDLYVERTFNEHDMEKLVKALYAMRDSEMQGKDLLNFYYRIAFSHNNPIKEDAKDVATALFLDTDSDNSRSYAEMVVPGLYGGRLVTESDTARFRGKSADDIGIEDIFPGDVLFVLPSSSEPSGAKMYVTDGLRLFDVTGKTEEISTYELLATISANDYFALLRPSVKMTSEVFYRSEPFYEGEGDIEKAIISTADAFLLRGDRMQYADTRLTDKVIYRWERNKAPEDYTVDEIGYTNCTGFTHDVYYAALGWDYGSFKLYYAPDSMIAYKYSLTGNETDVEIETIESELKSALQVGDIIFYRYSTNNHAMLYVGNGNLLHATGTVYSDYSETEEAAVRYQRLDCLFYPESSRYFFQTEKPRSAIYVIRPLNGFSGDIPERTSNRLENMNGVIAEKISSHPLGKTVNAGGLITYTFKIFNANDHFIEVEIEDTVPEGTVLFADGLALDSRSISRSVKIAPGEETEISYTVKVSEDAERGSAIICAENSSVGGISVKSTPVFVGRTLSDEEQKAVVDAAYALINGEEKSISLANKIYKEALGVDLVLGESMTELRAELFIPNGIYKEIATEGKYAKIIAPTLYGGKNIDDSDRFLGERARMLWERNLVIGDVLYFQSANSGYLYIYVGEGKFVDLQKFTERDAYERLEEAIAWKEFAVLRPSLSFE